MMYMVDCMICDKPFRKISAKDANARQVCPDCDTVKKGNRYAVKRVSQESLEKRLSHIEQSIDQLTVASELAIDSLRAEMLRMVQDDIHEVRERSNGAMLASLVDPYLQEMNKKFNQSMYKMNNRIIKNANRIEKMKLGEDV
tara:strand:+ start:604 stop:1029 length:426 start_codon:yes stop_codon:yes gene_type:complete